MLRRRIYREIYDEFWCDRIKILNSIIKQKEDLYKNSYCLLNSHSDKLWYIGLDIPESLYNTTNMIVRNNIPIGYIRSTINRNNIRTKFRYIIHLVKYKDILDTIIEYLGYGKRITKMLKNMIQ